jgi:hypothetical protein
VPRACVASVDSVFDCGGGDYSLQSKGNILYSAATANSTMDSSTKIMEDGIVDSPPTRNAQPLRTKSMTPTHIQGSFSNSRSSRKLHGIPSSSMPSEVVKVNF